MATNEKRKLMSASGNTFCEVSVVHKDVDAVAWVEFPAAFKLLSCGECADAAKERRMATVLRDLRSNDEAECDTCGYVYHLATSHNCTREGGAPYIIRKDER